MSADPATCLQYSRNQRRLYWDMVRQPDRYTRRREPSHLTDWRVMTTSPEHETPNP